MTRKLISYVFFFLFSIICLGQQEYKPYLVRFQNTLFLIGDSAYEVTRYIESSGYITYCSGLYEKDPLPSSWVFPDSKDIFVKVFDKASDAFDTIKCLYPLDIYKKDIDYLFPEFIGSYILRQVGETNIEKSDQDIVRIIVPCDELNFSYNFHVVTIVFEGELGIIYRSVCRSSDYSGYQMIERDSLVLGKKDVRRVRRILEKMEEVENKDCRADSGSPMIIETIINGHYGRSTIFYTCFHRSRDKDLSKLIGFYRAIQGVGMKHFKMDCRIEIKQRKDRWPPPAYND